MSTGIVWTGAHPAAPSHHTWTSGVHWPDRIVSSTVDMGMGPDCWWPSWTNTTGASGAGRAVTPAILARHGGPGVRVGPTGVEPAVERPP